MDKSLKNLIDTISRLPTLGQRSARKIVLSLISSQSKMNSLITELSVVKSTVRECSVCFNLDTADVCSICSNPSRDDKILCIVESVNDIWSIEKSATFHGKYHVLGGVLSALHGITPEKLNIESMISRINDNTVSEIVFALGSTLDAQTTIMYISDLIKDTDISITRLAFGIPMGADLEYIDDGTMHIAFRSRKKI